MTRSGPQSTFPPPLNLFGWSALDDLQNNWSSPLCKVPPLPRHHEFVLLSHQEQSDFLFLRSPFYGLLLLRWHFYFFPRQEVFLPPAPPDAVIFSSPVFSPPSPVGASRSPLSPHPHLKRHFFERISLEPPFSRATPLFPPRSLFFFFRSEVGPSQQYEPPFPSLLFFFNGQFFCLLALQFV